MFRNFDENSISLNGWGITNFTILKTYTYFKQALYNDLDHGNTLKDQFVQQNFKRLFFDKDAAVERKGNVGALLLKKLLDHPFFNQ